MGSIVAAVGLQFFLLPNHLLDGGVTGLSIIAAQLSGLPLGLFLVALNIPFVIMSRKKFGHEFAVYSLIGIIALALLTTFHFPHGFTDVPILAAIFGGLLVGVGVGLVIRIGGVIDGADSIAVLIDRVTVFSVSEAVLVINGIIITAAGFVFGWEQALYSLIAYFVAHKAVDVTVEGLDTSRSVWVVSLRIREVGHAINVAISEPVTYLKESDEKDREPHGTLLVVTTRFQEERVKRAIRKADPKAFIMIAPAHEILGKISEDSLHRADATGLLT